MKKFLVPALAAISLSGFAQTLSQDINVNATFQNTTSGSSWQGSAYYDFKAHRGSAVVFNTIGALTIHGKPTGVEASGFVGVQNSKGTPATIGVALLWHKTLFDQVNLVFGFGGSLTAGKWGGGPVLGASVHF